ncbi:WD40-repeat-containing domain protein [Fusarium oxysporum]|nr:WD40-repeat-containing domain protein [Fusarium oxysporum]
MLIKLQDIAKEGNYTTLRELLTDNHRFLRMNFTIIDKFPLQLYSSLRCTIPSSSLLHHIFTKSKPLSISQLPSPPKDWDQHQQLLEGHKTKIVATSFSMDSTHMVSLSWDCNIRVWRLNTGECIREISTPKLKSTDASISVSTSSNTVLVLVKVDKKLRFWRGDTAELMGEFEIPLSTTLTPQLSPCAQYCPFINYSHHFALLHLGASGQVREVYLEHSETVCGSERHVGMRSCLLSFSRDSTCVAFSPAGSPDTSFLWDIESGKCTRKIQDEETFKVSRDGSSVSKRSLGLCDDALLVAFAPEHSRHQIEIRWLQSGNVVQTFKGQKGYIKTTSLLSNCKGGVSISADYQMACSRQGSQTISVTANTRNGLSMSIRFSRDLVQKLILSADATVAASISLFDTIRVWDFRIGMCMSTIENSRLNPTIRYCSPQISNRTFITSRSSCDKIQKGRDIAISPNSRLVSLVHYDQEIEMCAWREKWGSHYVW